MYQYYNIIFFSFISKGAQYEKDMKGREDEKGLKNGKNDKSKEERKDKKGEKGKEGHQKNKINLVVEKIFSPKISIYYYIIYKC